MQEIYFDNAATTKPFPEVIELHKNICEMYYANPSSTHRAGLLCERELKAANRTMAQLLHVAENEVIYTSGGTEANVMGILGVARGYERRGKHIVTTMLEHPSVEQTCIHLQEQGFEISYIGADENGLVSPEAVAEAVRPDTILVAVMHVNNELGTIQPVDKINRLIKEKNKHVIFLVDGIQGFAKHDINLLKSGIDLFSFSAHKFHGLKGIGGLYVNPRVRLRPLLFGGSQQNGLRPGTENVQGIITMAHAAKLCYERMEETEVQVRTIRGIIADITQRYANVHINGDGCLCSPYILNISFEGINAEIMQSSLSQNGIYVSTGAACNVGRNKHNVLQKLPIPARRAGSAVRFSFSADNTTEDAERCLEVLESSIKMLRRR